MLPQLLSCAYSYKYLEVLWLPKRTQLWACFNTEPNRLYRRLRLFPSKLQEYTPPPFSRLSTQYHIDPLLTCFLSLDTSRTSLRLQQSTKFGNRHPAHGLYEYSYNLATSRENWAQKKKSRPGRRGGACLGLARKGASSRSCFAFFAGNRQKFRRRPACNHLNSSLLRCSIFIWFAL